MVKLGSCRHAPIFRRRSRLVLGMLFGLSYRNNLGHGERIFRNKVGLCPFCSGKTLGKPSPGYIFMVGPYQFCSHGNPMTLSTQLWSYLIILSDTHTTFYGQWHIFRVRRQPPCGGSFARPGIDSSLATRKGATVEAGLARCHCSSELCLSSEAAVQEPQLWDCYQLARSKMVLDEHCAVQKRWSCEVVGSHHCWLDISWPIAYFPISTSGKFAWLEVVKARCHDCNFAHLSPAL